MDDLESHWIMKTSRSYTSWIITRTKKIFLCGEKVRRLRAGKNSEDTIKEICSTLFYIILLGRGNSFSVAILCRIFWQKESLNIGSKDCFFSPIWIRTCPRCSHANLCPVVTFLLGCIPQCAAAAPACTSPTPARGFQTGPRQFHTALRRKPWSSGWIWGWRTNRASRNKGGFTHS